MARETRQHTVDGFDYAISQLGAKVGRKLLARIVRVLAGAAGSDDPGAKLAAALTDEEIDNLCDTLAATTQFSPAGDASKAWSLKDKFDDHFAGRYGAMVKWLWAALETNFGSFLSEFGISADGLAEKAKAALSGTPSESETPRSGASSTPATGA